MEKGKIVFISGPSGVGKGTLINELKARYSDFLFPASWTTRSPRPGESDGDPYHFISRAEFERKVETGEFLEHACVHGNDFYGTLRAPLIEGVEAGKVVVKEFDVQGFEQARTSLPRDYFTSIFLSPAEEVEDLIRRIRERDNAISDEEIKRRVQSMKKEISLAKIYDHIIISEVGQIDKLVADAEAIITEETGIKF